MMLRDCTPASLRGMNVFVTLLTGLLACHCRHLIETGAVTREGKPAPRGLSVYALHTAFNIALFPLIFFFSALYYTDVASTLVVLVAYRNHLLRVGGPSRPGLINDLWTVVLGVVALFMRQTNVFWVVVYMGGQEAVHVLRSAKPTTGIPLTGLHDPPLGQSRPEGMLAPCFPKRTTPADKIDWMFCGLTTAVTAVCNPVKVLRQIWPHITILALFGGFVAWNGGVVLGMASLSNPHHTLPPY